MSIPQDLTKSAQQIIVDMINNANNTTYTVADVTFGTPIKNPAESERNTDLDVTIGGVKSRIHYNRLDLGVLAQDLAINVPTAPNVGEDVVSLLPYINNILDLNLTAADIQNAPLNKDDDNNWPHPVVLKAADSSLCYYGQFSFDLFEAA